VHTVGETDEFVAAAKKVGMTEEERFDAVTYVSRNPEAGVIIEGSGGCRKVRIPKRGKGKSGGYRVVTYYWDEATPVYLLTVISKGQTANLTAKQKNRLKSDAQTEKRRRKQ
jgi:hypothetical protein